MTTNTKKPLGILEAIMLLIACMSVTNALYFSVNKHPMAGLIHVTLAVVMYRLSEEQRRKRKEFYQNLASTTDAS